MCFAALLVAVSSLSGLAAAQNATDADEENLKNILDMMRSEINTAKIETLNGIMQLTGEEADKFWPIYQEYEKELAAIGDERVAQIREFLEMNASGTTDDKQWDSLIKRMIENLQRRVDLWSKYQKKVSNALSPIRAAQFLQVEHQMAILIDLNIALEMPTIGPPAGTGTATSQTPVNANQND
jgi:hypothetical protein